MISLGSGLKPEVNATYMNSKSRRRGEACLHADTHRRAGYRVAWNVRAENLQRLQFVRA